MEKKIVMVVMAVVFVGGMASGYYARPNTPVAAAVNTVHERRTTTDQGENSVLTASAVNAATAKQQAAISGAKEERIASVAVAASTATSATKQKPAVAKKKSPAKKHPVVKKPELKKEAYSVHAAVFSDTPAKKIVTNNTDKGQRVQCDNRSLYLEPGDARDVSGCKVVENGVYGPVTAIKNLVGEQIWTMLNWSNRATAVKPGGERPVATGATVHIYHKSHKASIETAGQSAVEVNAGTFSKK